MKKIFEMHIEPSHKEIIEYIKSLNLPLLLHDIFVNKKTKTEIFEEFNKNISEKIEEFRNKVETLRKGFMKMEEILHEI